MAYENAHDIVGITYRKGSYTEGDNSINLEVDIQLQDTEVTDHGAEFWFSFGAKLPNYVIIYDKKISVDRDNSERPILEISATVNTTLSTS